MLLARPLTMLATLSLVTVVGIACRVAAAEPAPPAFSREQEEFFEKEIRPLLVKKCIECHGSETQEAGLRLDSREHVLAGAEGVAVVIVGKPQQSRLVTAIRYDGTIQMPPDGKLPASEIAALTNWIQQGLPWPKSATSEPDKPKVAAPAADAFAQRIAEAQAKHWSLQPVKRPELPAVKAGDWCSTAIDRFILSKLEERQLAPSPAADRRTLLRRVSYDLLGLPPTAEEADAFASDPSPDAYPRAVDRLLASPLYGQRWGRHWLDIARYADTKGYAFQQEGRFPYAFTYRNYVIQAFNDDLPFDRFILEQLAADKLPPSQDNHTLAALGFLTVGRQFNSMHDTYDDQIDVVTRGFLGLTVTCARCHDHKFDPIPSEDYYSLYGVFRSSAAPPEPPLLGEPAPSPEYEAYQHEFAKRNGELTKFLDEEHTKLLDELRSRAGDYLAKIVLERHDKSQDQDDFSFDRGDPRPQVLKRWRDYLDRIGKRHDPIFAPWKRFDALKDDEFKAKASEVLAAIEKDAHDKRDHINPLVVEAFVKQPPESMLDVAKIYGALLAQVYQATSPASDSAFEAELRHVLFAERSPPNLTMAEAKQIFDRASKEKLTKFEKQVDELKVTSPGAPPRAMSLVDERNPFNPYVFIRGDQSRRGKEVPRRFLSVLSSGERQPFTDGSGRLELARAIATPANPLTARVLVNRVWMQHFGTPLVITPSDFGVRCEAPQHLGLLDHLAAEFMSGGWSIKRLHRMILLSNVYQQACADRSDCITKDPENRLFWRANRRRLELEPLRDSLLFVSGRLDTSFGGRGVQLWKPPYPTRRTVYGFVDRQDLPGVFHTFDFANPDSTNDERPRTTVPQQALFVMNSPLVLEQARQVAARPEIAGQQEPRAKAAAVYRIVLGRTAQDRELDLAVRFVESLPKVESSAAAAKTVDPPAGKDAAKPASGLPLGPWEMFAHVLLLTNEFMFVD